MDKTATTKSLDDAFHARVATCFAQLCANSEHVGYKDARARFEKDLAFARRAHADVSARLAAAEETDASALEDDDAYRTRILAATGAGPAQRHAAAVVGPDLDAHGATIGVKRGPKEAPKAKAAEAANVPKEETAAAGG